METQHSITIREDQTRSEWAHDLSTRREALDAIIDAAYWAFTRQARAKPPSMVCGWAFAERNLITDILRYHHRKSAPICPRHWSSWAAG